MQKLLLLPAVFCCLLGPAVGYKFYQDRIPNGHQVPHPCKANYIWQGVGHLNSAGGGRRNPFGLAFEAAGKRWTSDLCRADSDGDGRTNGEELGDPDCKWSIGTIPERVKGVSHPGVCEPFDSSECKKRNDWVDCSDDELVCPALDKPDVKSVDLRMPRTKVPTNETFYVCVTLDLPTDGDYHMIALKPIIDNQHIMHHSTIYGCADPGAGKKFETPGECGMAGLGAGCDLVGVWTLGSPGHCYHDNVGISIGKKAMKRVIIQNHWTNPEHRDDWYDSSGIRIFYTPNKRQYDGATYILGQNHIVIPPGVPSMDVVGHCTSDCTKKNFEDHPIFIADALMHAHYLGTGIRVRHKRGDQDMGYLVNEKPYSYDNPIFHSMKPAREIRAGDELTITCSYQSMTRQTTTEWGLGTYDEMCYAILFYYPAMPATRRSSCIPFDDISSCTGEYMGCHNHGWTKNNATQAKLTEVVNSCPTDRCDARCALAVRKVKNEPCLQSSNFIWQSKFGKWVNKKIIEFFDRWETLKRCDLPQNRASGSLNNHVIG